MNNKVCFIILHYGPNIDLTEQAVDAAKKLDFDGNKDVVVVCNGKEYDITAQLSKKAKVIVLDKNEGFSKGNNAGYATAKADDDYDFMIIMNNDVVIEQADFLTKLYKNYARNPFYVAGPDIYTPFSDYHSSPMYKNPPDINRINAIINSKTALQNQLKKRVSISAYKDYLAETKKKSFAPHAITKLWRKIRNNNKNYLVEQKNVVLQGSCVIFSKDYIAYNDKAFEPEVFLYFEENYLCLKCRKNNWPVVYFNDLQVMHYHRGSSGLAKISYKEYCEKKIAITQRFIDSAVQYREYIATEQ